MDTQLVCGWVHLMAKEKGNLKKLIRKNHHRPPPLPPFTRLTNRKGTDRREEKPRSLSTRKSRPRARFQNKFRYKTKIGASLLVMNARARRHAHTDENGDKCGCWFDQRPEKDPHTQTPAEGRSADPKEASCQKS